ncbi:SusC/RagA family TonB-linked outer membrane protein [Microbacter margulisiae]|uniref:TonB-linked SusC/RagA family outer membrane protein n=1 Tax=Microbacter margulisiae TaxID=1350067 RepID=A0A7W5H2N8_9PORP|nr:TonB-dependent receptor [Microbacter margulisiae]MBB3187970.1 TonB-linked SusC/RagA family outer membrane protein [Microbacter margulisiae]
MRILVLMGFCMWAGMLWSQTRSIHGIVKDEHGTTVIGASVVVKGTTIGTATDVNGMFSLNVPVSAKTLTVSFIGMITKEVPISGDHLVVVLQENSVALNEVVAIGYGTVSKKDLTGSVAAVTGKSIASIPVSNLAQAMQGKLPGVNIISQDGRPDASVSILVRGGTSISQSNQPLVLIDGVPGSLSDIPTDQVKSIFVLKDASSTAIYGARGANGVILVTTKQAETGKATVSYDGYVEFNTPTKYLATLNPYDYLKYVWANAAANGTAYETPFEQLFGLGSYTTNNSGGIESYRNMATDDIQRKVYNSSVSMNHDITISGGTDKTKILFFTNYVDNEGMKVNSYDKHATVSLKINQKLFDNVNVSLDTRYTNSTVVDDEGTTSGEGSTLSSAYRFRPIATSHILGDLNALTVGNVEQYGKNSLWDTYSPLARALDEDPRSLQQGIVSTLSMDWNIIKGLTYHSDFTMNSGWNQTKDWTGAIYNNYIDDATGEKLYAGAVDYQKSDSWGSRWSNTLNYKFNVAKIHKFDLLLGYELTNSGGTGMRITANHFPANFSEANAFAMINQYDQTAGTSSFSSSVSVPERIISYFGRANYNLLDRYLLTVTLRADGSSKFSPIHRWGYFPAAAFAWIMSEESFMKNINWLDNLKLRLSYGSVGNDDINSNLWSQLWASETDRRWQYALNQQYQESYTYANSAMANENLKWETTITRDFGVDFDILKSILSGTVDIYWNTTKDLLMQTTIPGITGFTSTYANIGQTSNKGIEISLSSTIFKNKDWDITASGNINFNRNNVDKLASNVTGLYGTNWASSATEPVDDYMLKVGSPVGLVRGYVYDGFYTTNDFTYANGVYTLKPGIPDLNSTLISVVHGIPSSARPSGQIAYPGLPKFKDLNHDGKIDETDCTVIGNMNPIHTGGFNINVTYKNIDFGTYFNWSYGNQIYNVNKLASLYGPKEAGVYENKLSILNNSYKIYDVENGQLVSLTTPAQLDAANANASLPLAYEETGVTSTLGIENGSYLRLNTLTIGYSFPKAMMKKAGMDHLRIYGSIYNLLTITGYSGLDPEVNANIAQNHNVYPTPGLDWGTYPRARSFVVGMNLSF